MELTLKPETEATIQRVLESGKFADADALISTAIELLQAEQESRVGLRETLKVKLEESFAAVERGETVSGEEFEAEMDDWRARIG